LFVFGAKSLRVLSGGAGFFVSLIINITDMACTNIKIPAYNPLLDCQGNPHSNDDLKLFLKNSIENQDYIDAQIYHNELVRRGVKYNPLRD